MPSPFTFPPPPPPPPSSKRDLSNTSLIDNHAINRHSFDHKGNRGGHGNRNNLTRGNHAGRRGGSHGNFASRRKHDAPGLERSHDHKSEKGIIHARNQRGNFTRQSFGQQNYAPSHQSHQAFDSAVPNSDISSVPLELDSEVQQPATTYQTLLSPNTNIQSTRKPNKPVRPTRSEVPPSVPSFGFSLPVLPATSQSRTALHTASVGKKRKFNQLGLTPKNDEREESEEEIDDEAHYANSSGNTSFAYKGQKLMLKSPEDVAAWLAERRARYPTKARIAEKLLQESKLAQSSETMQPRPPPFKKSSKPSRVKHGLQSSNCQSEGKHELRLEKEKRKLERLRRKLQESEAKLAKATALLNQPSLDKGPEQSALATQKATNNILGINYASDESEEDPVVNRSEETNSGAVFALSGESSELSTSSSESSSGIDSSTDSESDVAPAEESSKISRPVQIQVQRQVRHGVSAQKQPCNRYMKTGSCPYGNRCKFSHPQKTKVRLFDRLVKQEEKKSDQLVLKTIMYLGNGGFLS